MLSRIIRPLASKITLAKPLGVFPMSVRRSFAGPSDVDKIERKLSKIIAQEIEFEEDNYTEDTSINQFLKENKWVLQDTEGNNLVVLKKVSGNSVVQIYFTSKSPSFDNEDEQGDEQDTAPKKTDEADEGDDMGNQEFTDFNVYITQGKKTMAFECVTVNGEIEVNNCNVIEDINVHRTMSPFGTTAVENYKGPEFNTLDESLQHALFDLLRSHGVNEEVAQLIEHIALNKEQKLYMRWLGQVKDFLEQKQSN